MTGTFSRLRSPEPYRSIIFLGAVILLRALGQYFFYTRGFLRVSADEFARGVIAASWASRPRFDLFDGPPGAWLPFEKYLNGLVLNVWPDPVLAPRITVFLSSCLVLICLYLLVRFLFGRWSIAALAIVFVIFQPWVVWLSGTPMLEMYYLAFFLAGLLFLLVWLRDELRGFWILAGLSFALCSGFHVQSWYLINIVNLLTVGFLAGYVRRRHFRRTARFFGYYFLSNALIITVLIVEYVHTGKVLGFLSTHTDYSLWFYGGYQVDLIEKLSYYPEIILGSISAVIWILVIVALLFIYRDQDRLLKLFPLITAVCNLVVSSLANVLSGPPSAAPARYSLFYVLMLAPYIAYGAHRMVDWARHRPSRIVRYAVGLLAVGLFTYSVFWGAMRTLDHPRGPRDTLEVGRQLNELLSQADPGDEVAYMLELKYWDFLAIQLTSAHYDDTLFDRVNDMRNRDAPSIFAQDAGEFYDDLKSQNVRFVVLSDPDLKANVESAQFMSIKREVGAWTIYQFEP